MKYLTNYLLPCESCPIKYTKTESIVVTDFLFTRKPLCLVEFVTAEYSMSIMCQLSQTFDLIDC